MRVKIFVIMVLALAVVFGSGCAKKDTYVGPGGEKVTVTKEGGKAKNVEVDTGEGKATVNIEKKKITEKELGVPVYPGAVVELTGQFEGNDKNKTGSLNQTMLTTTDSFEKVSAFYKTNLKKIENSMTHEMGGSKMSMYTIKAADGTDIAVNVIDNKEKKVTTIQVVKMPKPIK